MDQHALGSGLITNAGLLAGFDHAGAGFEDFGRVDGFLERQVSRWRSQLDQCPRMGGYGAPDILHLEELGRWLDRNRPDSFTPGLLRGDFHIGNVMFRHGSPDVSAVVDWEL